MVGVSCLKFAVYCYNIDENLMLQRILQPWRKEAQKRERFLSQCANLILKPSEIGKQKITPLLCMEIFWGSEKFRKKWKKKKKLGYKIRHRSAGSLNRMC